LKTHHCTLTITSFALIIITLQQISCNVITKSVRYLFHRSCILHSKTHHCTLTITSFALIIITLQQICCNRITKSVRYLCHHSCILQLHSM